jgi:acetyl esterase/lipase
VFFGFYHTFYHYIEKPEAPRRDRKKAVQLKGEPMKTVIYSDKISLTTRLLNKILKLRRLFDNKNGEYDAVKLRPQIDKMQLLLCGRFPSGVVVTEAKYCGTNTRIYTPENIAADNVLILHIHGGGYMHGSVKSYNTFCGRFSKALSLPLISLDYPLAPENPFPAALDTIVGLYKYLGEEYSNHRIILAGDSAGGGLALAAALMLRDGGFALPELLLLFSPSSDLTMTSPYIEKNEKTDIMLTRKILDAAKRHYAAPEQLTHPYVSPVYADFRDFPPVFIQCGDSEMLYGDSVTISDRIGRDGGTVELNVWRDMPHAFIVAGPIIAEHKKAAEQVRAFIRRRIENYDLNTTKV